MQHMIRLAPPHVRMATGEQIQGEALLRPMEAYHFGTELPHFLSYRAGIATLIVPITYSIRIDDLIANEYGGEILVTEVLERRKARGDWSRNPYDEKPDFVKIRYI